MFQCGKSGLFHMRHTDEVNDGSRPLDDGEGIPGYLVDPQTVKIATEDENLLVSCSSCIRRFEDKRPGVVLVCLYASATTTINEALLGSSSAIDLSVDFLGKTSSTEDGSFSAAINKNSIAKDRSIVIDLSGTCDKTSVNVTMNQEHPSVAYSAAKSGEGFSAFRSPTPTPSPAVIPEARALHAAAWTGSKMIIWAGQTDTYFRNGYLFDPDSQIWTPMSSQGAPTGRSGGDDSLASVWHDGRLYTYGGHVDAPPLNLAADGAYFDLASNQWTALSATTLGARGVGSRMATSDSQFFIFGGWTNDGGSRVVSNGRLYNYSGSWIDSDPPSNNGCPFATHEHVMVWTGKYFLIWGGATGGSFGSPTNAGCLFDPANNTWTPMTTSSAPSARAFASFAFSTTKQKLVVWGGATGSCGSSVTDTGAVFDVTSKTWSTMNSSGAPSARISLDAVWTDGGMFVFGGTNNICESSTGSPVGGGGIYNPDSDSWKTLPAENAPSGRVGHSIVSAGNLVIVWGGRDASGKYLSDGGIYNVAEDRWTAIRGN